MLGNRKAGREGEKEREERRKKERKERLSLPFKTLKIQCGSWAVKLIHNRRIRTVVVMCS